jgi:hypothetical protein
MIVPHRSTVTRLAVALTLVVFLAACASPSPASPGADDPDPSAPPPAAEATLAPEILEAIAFRESMGLRSDAAWAQAVAANPNAVMDWGVPLMPFEAAEIERRATGDDAVVGEVQAYLGEHADISGGLYIDQARGGVVTMLVTEDAAGHEAAVRERIGPDARFAVREVRWTEQALMDLQTKITADPGFLASIPAFVSTTSTDVIDNVVEVTVSSAVPDVGERIAAHVGAEPGQLRVTSDGTGLLLQPTGRIEGRIIAPPGVDMANLSPQYEADVDIGPRTAEGIAVAPDGTFTIERLPPTGYRVYVLELLANGNREAGSARVTVPPGGVGVVEIVYDGP